MTLALLVSLVCLGAPGPVSVAAVKHMPTENAEIVGGDAQCCECPCWLPPIHQCGCAVGGACTMPCGYQNITEYGIPWGPWGTTGDGCVDLDLLPVPQDDWVYWVTVP